MKDIQIKKEVTEFIYEAYDGTQFSRISECEEYEKTAECALVAMYENQIQKLKITEYDFSQYFGNPEYDYDIVKINTIDDLELIIKAHLFYVDCDPKNLPSHELERTKFIKECYDKGHHILIDRGDPYSRLIRITNISLESMIERLNSFIEKVNNKNTDENNN